MLKTCSSIKANVNKRPKEIAMVLDFIFRDRSLRKFWVTNVVIIPKSSARKARLRSNPIVRVIV